MTTRRTDEIIFTSIYLIGVILTIVPYIIILVIIKRRQKEFSGPAYKIMFNLGIADCIQLLAHSFAFIFTMADSTFSYWINKIAGSFLNGAFETFIACTLLLAFNRFVMLCLPKKKADAFDGNVMTFLLILVWLPGLSMFITILTPECSMIYYLESTSWDYTNETWCPVINDIDFYYSVGMCIIGAALYFLIFGKHLLMRKKYNSFDNKFKGEIKLLFQACIIGGYTIFSEVVWHFAYEFIPDELLASFLGNILWIGEAGLTPYIYLLINNSIRNAFFETLRLKKPSLIVPTNVAPANMKFRSISSVVVHSINDK